MWFSAIGTKSDGMYLSSLAKLDDLGGFEWFPTSRDSIDSLKYDEFQLDEDAKTLYRRTLKELRPIRPKHIGLYHSPHDYTEAAKGALLFSIIRADHAARHGNQTTWTKIQQYFNEGHWPLGVQESTGIIYIL